LSEHPAAGFLTHGKPTDHQVLQDSMQVIDRKVFWFCEMPVTGDVAQEIDSSELNVYLAKQLGDGIGIGHVRASDESAGSSFAAGCGSRFGTVDVPIDQRDVGTGFGQSNRRRLSHALGGSRYDGHSAGQIEH
jgi:hypothetical protein